MFRLTSTTALLAFSASMVAASEKPVRIGLLFGFTGPIESMAPEIAASAELALEKANKTGLFLDGRQIETIRADSTCVDAPRAVAAAERLVTADQIDALIGADCSGVAGAVASGVTVPNGILSISPTATSPNLTSFRDNGLFFRTAPSDTRQGEVLADVLIANGIRSLAVTYTANDYGKGLAVSFSEAFSKKGGEVLVEVPHVDGTGDYSAEVATLAASGAEILLVAGYADQGGQAIVRSALDLGAFDRFVFPDGMVAASLVATFGDALVGSIGTLPGSETEDAVAFDAMLLENGIPGQAPYRAEAYDAAALLAFAFQAAHHSEGTSLSSALMRVANAPGVEIGHSEIETGLKILAEGGEIDYVGASSVEFTPDGDATGTYREVVFTEDGFKTVAIR
ncbi:ABC transporter substrate-binding protein [Ruegeria atlantica]|uniref:ABC transporter substrate-binding protein n=1 Tax=Ruegeria atlantica TaxID=81569 RepID=UPI00147DA4B4|nr:ABC transporter substrate-binding protein [Ruegeria atlantica]